MRARRGLIEWLSTTTTPLFLLDHRRVVLFFNSGCEALTGWTAAEVIGRPCRWIAEVVGPVPEALLAALCPPEAVLDGEPQTVTRTVPHKTESAVQRPCRLHFVPLQFAPSPGKSSRGPAPFRILGIVTPVPFPVELARAGPEIEQHAALAELLARIHQQFGIEQFVAASPAMRRVIEQIQTARAGSFAVHLVGTAGTGRTHVARTIHTGSSGHSSRSFAALDCVMAAPSVILEQLGRLLTHEPGDPHLPFLAPGTVCIRALGRLPRDAQRVLVEAFDSGRARSYRWVTVDDQPLRELVQTERLLPELAAHLGIMTIELPPLCERPADIPLLAQLLLERANRESQRQVTGFAADVLNAFAAYSWPGQVKELETVITAAAAAATRPVIALPDLPWQFRAGQAAEREHPPQPAPVPPLEPYLSQIEAELLRRALAATGGNKSEAAELLGVSRPRLYRRLEELGITDTARGVEPTAAPAGETPTTPPRSSSE